MCRRVAAVAAAVAWDGGAAAAAGAVAEAGAAEAASGVEAVALAAVAARVALATARTEQEQRAVAEAVLGAARKAATAATAVPPQGT